MIYIDSEIKKCCPAVRLACIRATVHVGPSNEAFLNHTKTVLEEIKSILDIDDVSRLPAIRETKEVYRLLGKDPSRYRPSAEALMRRVLNGKDLYQVNNVIDALNLISLKFGYSIGGYDENKISGNVRLGVGKKGEAYEAIGRGALNIEHLPVLRDDSGAFGSPTSDTVRTMITDDTDQYLMVIFDFKCNQLLDRTVEDSIQMLEKYCDVTKISTIIVE